MKGEFMNWTDATSSRTLSIVENLMGESIQLHQDYVLQDELRHRPMFVNYRYAFNYIVEALIIILLTKRAEKKIFRPLLSDVPAVRTKYTTVCHILSGWLCLILRPET
jgi:hypothetical protein